MTLVDYSAMTRHCLELFSLQRPECISRHITHYVQNRPDTRPFLGRFGPRL